MPPSGKQISFTKHTALTSKRKKLDFIKMKDFWDFPGGAVVKNLPVNAGNTGSSPALVRSHMPRSN